MDRSPEAFCEISSLCACVLFQPNATLLLDEQLPKDQLALLLLNEAVRVRKDYDFFENPTVVAVRTSFFIFVCSGFYHDRQKSAWAYLREATTLAHIVGLPDESTYISNDSRENGQRRRLFWVLFTMERW